MIKVGHIREAHGLKGEVKVFLESRDGSWFKKAQKIILQPGEHLKKRNPQHPAFARGPQTFSLASVRQVGETFVFTLKEVKDRTTAENMVGLEVWIDEKAFATKKGEAIFLREVSGFEVYDGEVLAGIVEGFEENPHQDILRVKTPDGHEALVPLIKDFLIRIDFAAKKIFMKLPEGLLEVNRAL